MTEKLGSDDFRPTAQDKSLLESISAKLREAGKQNERLSVIKESELYALLDDDEINLVKGIYAINPQSYGFKGHKVGVEPVPDNLVRIEPKKYHFEGQELYTNVQFIPQPTYAAFQKLSAALEADLGRPILIVSSYRSNAFQAMIFLKYLKHYDFDVSKTAMRVAIPGYSEHTTPSSLALDIANLDGLPSDKNPQDFETTKEYEWLKEHAADFDFYESYPKDNDTGIMFEPWHWRHISLNK